MVIQEIVQVRAAMQPGAGTGGSAGPLTLLSILIRCINCS